MTAHMAVSGPMMIERWTRPEHADPETRRRLVECWLAVSNAGGAVGFPFPPVAENEVAVALDQLLEDLDPQSCVLFHAWKDSTVTGWVVLRRTPTPLLGHWGTVERLQTHPTWRGRGIGAALLDNLERYSRDELGLVQLHLAARSGLGLERYYGRLGWQEIGRWPRILRLAENDERDEILMLRQLI